MGKLLEPLGKGRLSKEKLAAEITAGLKSASDERPLTVVARHEETR